MNRHTFSVILALLLAVQTAMEVRAVPFRKIRMENGLSHNYVQCILQDRYDLIWIGTSNGLNCYYGNSNKIFRNDDRRSVALPSNQITALFDASPDSLWIGCSNGICLHDRFKGSFSLFDVRTDYGVVISSEVRCILNGMDGAVWIGTMGQGLFRYDGSRLEQFISETSFVTDMAIDMAGNIYVASLDNMLRIYTPSGLLKDSMPMESPVLCLYYAEGKVYVGIERMVVCIGRDGNEVQHNRNTRCIISDPDGNLFWGTDHGLYFQARGSDEYVRIDNAPTQSGLSNLHITCMMRDRSGGIWVGTAGGGVNYMTEQAMVFRCHDLPSLGRQISEDSLGELVSVVCETPGNTLYLGTNKGVYVLSGKDGNVVPYAPVAGRKLDVYALWAEDSYLWVGTKASGLVRINVHTGDVREYTRKVRQDGSLEIGCISAVLRGSDGVLYVGTDDGLWRLNETIGTFEQEPTVGSMLMVEDLCEDSVQNLWIATAQNGIYRYTLHNKHWRHYRRNPNHREGLLFSNGVNALKLDKDGRLWIGTDGNGIGIYDAETDSFQRKDGNLEWDRKSAGHVVRDIEQDKDGNLWTIDENGLTRYLLADSLTGRTWTVDNGLPMDNYGRQTVACLSNGLVVLGGEGGVVTFNPRELKPKETAPAAKIVGISFPYEKQNRENTSLTDYRMLAFLPDRLDLPYERNSFRLEFASTDYESPEKTLYRYSLETDKNVNWSQPTGMSTASFTELAPGTYTLLLEAANADGVWSSKPSVITVTIRPPWWSGVGARIVYALLAMAVVGCAAWMWNAYVKKKYRKRMKEVEAGRQAEVYRQKINFFVNLVHEIRTPLSLIRLPLEQIIEKGGQNEENARLLSLVDKNVNYLLNVSNQLLDLQRLENDDNFMLHLQVCDAGEMADSLLSQFVEAARLKGTDFILERPAGEIKACIDRDKVYKILVNLASNALKYARTRIQVTLEQRTDGSLCWTVDDDGPGIPPAEREKIFNTFYRIENGTLAPGGTGIGLSYARALAVRQGGTLNASESPSGGARFTLLLPSHTGAEADNPVLQEKQNTVIADAPQDGKKRKDVCVLIVEDNAELLKLTAESLSEWFRTRRAANGRKALDLLQEEDCDVDVIVCDVMMPVMDGLELCRRVKQDINMSHLPFIMLTAKTTLEAKTEGMSCGADAYLEKPFSIRQLKAQIDNLLRLRKAFYRRMENVGRESLADDMPDDMEGVLTERDREFVARLEQLIVNNISDESLSIDDLATDLKMSRSNFYRKIKALTDMSPADYLKTVRLNKAQELLRAGGRISDVYMEVGFNSPSYFTKCFKMRYGITPREYVVSCRQNAVEEMSQDNEADTSEESS